MIREFIGLLKNGCPLVGAIRLTWARRKRGEWYLCDSCQHPTEKGKLREVWEAGYTGEYLCGSCRNAREEDRQEALEAHLAECAKLEV